MIRHPAIIGAGLAGLLAAHAFPGSPVCEAAPRPVPGGNHHALLRFRSDAVSRLTGIDFRRVTVHKGIFGERDFIAPSIRAANDYEQKCFGPGTLTGARSIWNLDAAERFVAPPDFYEQLLSAVGDRISWDTKVEFAGRSAAPVISTAPMPATLEMCGIKTSATFVSAGIRVRRFRIPGADAFQTVYFTNSLSSLYRASITGDLLIAEFSQANPALDAGPYLSLLSAAFGIGRDRMVPLDDAPQRYGKIVAIPTPERKRLLFELTASRNIYSVGRFATWRNILLDDVVDDLARVKRMIAAGSDYDVRKAAS